MTDIRNQSKIAKLRWAIENNDLDLVIHLHKTIESDDNNIIWWYEAISFSIINTNSDIEIFKYSYTNAVLENKCSKIFKCKIACCARLDIITYLFESGNCSDIIMRDAFYNAAKVGNFDIFKYLYSNWCTNSTYVETAFTYCLNPQAFNIFKFLCEEGVDIHLHDDVAWKSAVQMLSLPMMKLLVEYGADVNLQNNYAIISVLVSGRNVLNIVKYLYENGADICCLDNLPIKLAVEYSSVGVVKYLHENGADIYRHSYPQIHAAVRYNKYDIVRYLCENSVNLNASKGSLIEIALYFHADLTIIKCLCEYGAHVSIQAVRHAAAYDRDVALRYFCENGTDISGVEFKGNYFNANTVKYIEEHGGYISYV